MASAVASQSFHRSVLSATIILIEESISCYGATAAKVTHSEQNGKGDITELFLLHLLLVHLLRIKSYICL